MKQKVTVSIDEGLLASLDSLVQDERFDSRSAAMEAGIRSLQRQMLDGLFEQSLAQLDPAEERAEAELGLADYAESVLGRDA
jgi:Arc/MetJ-type ribon-helix-helix transcriptional regulator